MSRPAVNPAMRARVLEAVELATVTRDNAERAWRREIVRAYERGLTMREVANAAGISHQRVQQIRAEVSSDA